LTKAAEDRNGVPLLCVSWCPAGDSAGLFMTQNTQRIFKGIHGTATLMLGDNRDVLPTMAGCHACVTDPPYGLKFMGKKWDYDVPSVGQWQAVLAALLPGAHLLSFAGTRTQHRMAVRIEDAGFEIRDMIAWIYGSGFPKSLDVGKAIDKAAGVEMESRGHFQFTAADKAATPGAFRTNEERANPGCRKAAPATAAAKQWDGWGTALKPALEPVTLARKPLEEATVAANVLKHGCGGVNVDGCRVGTEKRTYDIKGGENLNKLSRPQGSDAGDAKGCGAYGCGAKQVSVGTSTVTGRFPANLIHDGSEEVLAGFPVTTSGSKSMVQDGWGNNGIYGTGRPHLKECVGDSGSAARFFYCAKASRSDRGEGNKHCTVKPVTLMRYLCRLITPPGGIVLDPWMGSGSTGVAALREGFNFIGIELDPKHFETACERMAREIDGQLL